MKGLILNNFYSMLDNIKLSVIMSAAMLFVAVLLDNPSVLPIAISVQIFIFIANTGTSLQVDERSKWCKFELTLPIKKSSIIGAKYITFILLVCMGVLISLLTPILIYIVRDNIDISSLMWGYCYGLTLAISTIAFMYPIILKIGAEKSELAIFIAVFLVVAVMSLMSTILSLLTKQTVNFGDPLVGVVLVITSIILFFISYQISLCIYRKKEF